MRIRELDALRAFAVGAVLVEHAPFRFSGVFGWTGVDLFFVLSGFLVSGLLFAERRETGGIRAGRFLVRRGFKIYPPFYALLCLTVLVRLLNRHSIPVGAALSEALFVQNYGPRLWLHTWSLAVEEHFYLSLVLALSLLSRRSTSDPFRPLLVAVPIVAIAILAIRCVEAYVRHAPFETLMYATHCRIDALLAGTLVSYLFHYHRAALLAVIGRPSIRRVLIALALVLLVPAMLLVPSSRVLLTIGLSTTYLAYTCVLLFTIPAIARPRTAREIGPVMRSFAAVGRHSYSIYLWHVPILLWGFATVPALRAAWLAPFSMITAAFIAIAIAAGFVMSRAIEVPALALRDRLFPRVSSAPVGAIVAP